MEFGYHNASFVYEGAPRGTLNEKLTGHARLLEEGGFSWFTVMDHYWQLPFVGRRGEPMLDAYAALSAVAETTEEMTLSGLVTSVGYRNPALVAKQMVSLDVLSEGRAMLGIGAGWNEAEYDAVGEAFPDAETRVKQLRDAVRLCRTAWKDESPVDYDGEFFDLDSFYCNPKRKIPVLVGGGGESLTLRVAADEADWWNVPGADPETYDHKLGVLRDHCTDLGTAYGEIEKTVTVETLLRRGTEVAHEDYEELLSKTDAGPTPRDEFRGAVGTVEEACELVERYRKLGADVVQFQAPKNDRRTAELLVDEVLPEF
jgi:alkanesulfonate monooxygenase SsuD/methylene tetrahydromethanopterin reductase-like flavin-dependent oxidoreductase (luciferase family)